MSLINENKLLFFDIETSGSHATIEELEDKNSILFTLWGKMGVSYFRRHYPEDERMSSGELYKKYSGLLPEFGRVVCVSAGFINGGERKIQSFYKGSETDILKEVTGLFNKVHKLGFSLCGHNIKNFDLPYLGKRMLINKVKPSAIMPSHDTKPWEIKALDTKELWNFGSYKGLSALHLVCGVLGLETPKDGNVDGSNIHKSYYNDNNISEITEYCEKDVNALMDVITHVQSL
jgi:uncharacterized protein YprB with RNaseH-like and TPR domain